MKALCCTCASFFFCSLKLSSSRAGGTNQSLLLPRPGTGSSYSCENVSLPLQELTLQMNLLELIRKLQQKESESEEAFS